jgi:dolichol-phosphate mannosyltransferase
VLEGLPGGYELVFVNDASDDGSAALLAAEAAADPRVRVLTTSRRFGVSECTLAGFAHSRGEAVVYMDTDLQDPPELIPELIARWEAGADVVYTVREARLGESRLKVWATRAAYALIRAVAEVDLPVEAGDFRLVSRRVVSHVVRLGESDPYLRGLVSWVGFRQVAVRYRRAPRARGRSHFPLLGAWGPARTLVSGVASFSVAPLVLFLPLGLLALLASAAGWALVAWRFAHGRPDTALLALGACVASCAALQLIGIGVLGLYLGRVYKDVQGRPRYIVESKTGFDADA